MTDKAVIAKLNDRIEGYQASRDWAINRLAGALGVETDTPRALEYYAEQTAQEIERLRAESDSLAAVVRGIANANRWDREVVDNDDSFVAWAQSLCKHAIRTEASSLAKGKP